MVGLFVVDVVVSVGRRLSDALADGAVFMGIPDIYGHMPLWDCDCQ